VKNETLKNKTAILFFDHSKKQAATIRLMAPRIDSTAINQALKGLSKQALHIAHQSNFPVYQFQSKGEKSFGDELFDAYQSIYNQGFDAVIAIGNDCPTLKVADILLAAENVTSRRLAIGPALDGGTYLIGLHKDTFSRAQFLNLHWQESTLIDSFQDFMKENDNSCLLLTPKGDLDTPEEFRKAFSSHLSFLDQLLSIIASFQFHVFGLRKRELIDNFQNHFNLRGPPAIMN
jgi:hypothetical protein